MTCEAWQKLGSLFIDGELSDSQSGELFSHLSSCIHCRQFMHSAVQIRIAVMRSPTLAVPPTLDERVSKIRLRPTPARVPLRIKARHFWNQRFLVPVPAVLSAGMMLLVAIAISIASLTKSPRENQEAMTKTAYMVTLPAVEVQGSYPIDKNKAQ